MKNSKRYLSLCIYLLITYPVFSQEGDLTREGEADKVEQEESNIEDQIRLIMSEMEEEREQNKIFHFGLTLGARFLLEREEIIRRRNVSISPVDRSVQAESKDRFDVVLSGTVNTTPFVRFDAVPNALKGLGFMGKINIAEFSPESLSLTNKSIEGGIGVSYMVNHRFGFALTIDRVFGRRLRSQFEIGEPIVVGNNVIEEFDETDDRYFTDDGMSAILFMYVYVF